MSKNIEVTFNDGTTEEHVFPENFYEIDWNKWKKVERTIQKYAVMGRDGEIKRWEEDADFVEVQEQVAKTLLKENQIDPNEVKTKTIKELIISYADEVGELGLKLKKNRKSSTD